MSDEQFRTDGNVARRRISSRCDQIFLARTKPNRSTLIFERELRFRCSKIFSTKRRSVHPSRKFFESTFRNFSFKNCVTNDYSILSRLQSSLNHEKRVTNKFCLFLLLSRLKNDFLRWNLRLWSSRYSNDHNKFTVRLFRILNVPLSSSEWMCHDKCSRIFRVQSFRQLEVIVASLISSDDGNVDVESINTRQNSDIEFTPRITSPSTELLSVSLDSWTVRTRHLFCNCTTRLKPRRWKRQFYFRLSEYFRSTMLRHRILTRPSLA